MFVVTPTLGPRCTGRHDRGLSTPGRAGGSTGVVCEFLLDLTRVVRERVGERRDVGWGWGRVMAGKRVWTRSSSGYRSSGGDGGGGGGGVA